MTLNFKNVFSHSKKYPENLPEDTLLAYKAADGDDNAFEALVKKYERFVSTCVYPIVQNREDTLDVSQEAFLKTYRALGSFKGESEFSTWLYRIAKNCAYDFVRKKKGDSVSLDETDEDGKGFELADNDEKNSPEKAYERSERKEMLWNAINALSEEHREVIIMRDINSLTYESIAEKTGLEQGTVKSRLFRAREALKKLLQKENYF